MLTNIILSSYMLLVPAISPDKADEINIKNNHTQVEKDNKLYDTGGIIIIGPRKKER
ncbi:hypothetical protein [Pseudoalteromonas sp. SR41-6]|uniref:hypothetical protein n=1 Tax=Pseudoalteromonas sp. SR41-6 TaxID=2760948 RepID=UPI0015FF9F79|nr:hypothetical protein [Pseudoalteromonas sp. SR41-6]MBB1333931.1 hypothetical protein [Pseudoalteromonas sp. SR41-6]